MGPGGRAVEPERAPEPPWRALLESRSLPKEPLGHSPEPNQALATSSRPPASLHRLRVFLTLEADSDRLLARSRPARRRVWGRGWDHPSPRSYTASGSGAGRDSGGVGEDGFSSLPAAAAHARRQTARHAHLRNGLSDFMAELALRRPAALLTNVDAEVERRWRELHDK